MRTMLAICKRELLSFFVSPVAYFVITGFVFLAGYFFFNYLSQFAYYFEYLSMMASRSGGPGPNLNQMVIEGFYHTLLIVLVFLIPLLTMRIIAEEKRRGTFELLVTSPVSVSQIVFGKFFALAVVIVVMCVLAFFFPALLIIYGKPEVSPIFTGLLAVILSSLGFAAIGMAVSSFTENQVVAGVCSMVTLLLLYVIQAPAESMGGVGALVLKHLSPVEQAREMIQGVVTLKSLVYFLSLISLGMFLSQRALEAHRWR